jgi:hypothetical protein
MALNTQRKLDDKDITQKLILDSDSVAYISEDEILPHESDSEKGETQTHNGLIIYNLDLVNP